MTVYADENQSSFQMFGHGKYDKLVQGQFVLKGHVIAGPSIRHDRDWAVEPS